MTNMIDQFDGAPLAEVRDRITVLQARVDQLKQAPRAERLWYLPTLLAELFLAELFEAQALLFAERAGAPIPQREGADPRMLDLLRGS